LRDIPGLLKGAGDRWFKQGGSANLAAQFGLQPLVQDFKKLLSFNEDVEKRVKLLKKLSEGPMLRKVSLGEYSVSTGRASGNTTFQSMPGFFIDGRLEGVTTHRKVWGYCTWSPTEQFKQLSRNDDDLRAKARQIIGGYAPTSMSALLNLWNTLPWSWMADWFSDLGDYIEAHQNSVPLTPGTPRVCITTTTIARWSLGTRVLHFDEPSVEPFRDGTLTVKLTGKSRTIASASLPSASMPFLTGGQWGILASLAVTRFPSRFS
jgi:hypothetical protein